MWRSPATFPPRGFRARLRLGSLDSSPTTDVLYLPRGARAAPCFLCLNFRGNHAQHPDHGIRLAQGWVENDPQAESPTTTLPRPAAAARPNAGQSRRCSAAAIAWPRPITATRFPTAPMAAWRARLPRPVGLSVANCCPTSPGRLPSGSRWSCRTTRAAAGRPSCDATTARARSGSRPRYRTGSAPRSRRSLAARRNCPATSTRAWL